MRAAPGTFLNKEEKENKRRGIEIRTTCVEEKKKKKKTYGWNEGWERRNYIKNEKPNWEMLPQYFHNKL